MGTKKRTTYPDAIQTLRQHYELGCELRRRRREDRDTPSLQRLAKAEYACSEATLYKVLSLAEQFSQDEFEELCELRTPHGKSLTWAHVIALLPIRDKPVRSELVREAAANGWSPRALKFQIEQRGLNPRRRGDGRPVQQPTSPAEALWRLSQQSERWLRVYDVVLGPEVDCLPAPRSSPDAADCWVARAEHAITALTRMHAAVESGPERLRLALQQDTSTERDPGSSGRSAA